MYYLIRDRFGTHLFGGIVTGAAELVASLAASTRLVCVGTVCDGNNRDKTSVGLVTSGSWTPKDKM